MSGVEEKKTGFLGRVAGVFRRDSRPDAVELAPPSVDVMHVDVEALAHEAFVRQQTETLAQLQQEALQNEAAMQRQEEQLAQYERQHAALQQKEEAKAQLPDGMTRGVGRTVLTAAARRRNVGGLGDCAAS